MVSNRSPSAYAAEFAELCVTRAALFHSLASENLPPHLRAQAADAVQDGLLSAWDQLGRGVFRGDCKLVTWIAFIIKRSAWRYGLNHPPGGYERIGHGLDIADSAAVSPEMCAIQKEILSLVVQELRPTEREFLNQWKAGQFAGQMNQAKPRNMLHRTRRKMRRIAEKKRLLRIPDRVAA